MGAHELTRRSVLARALAGAGAVVVGRPSPAFGRIPTGEVFSVPVPDRPARRASAAAAGWHELAPVRSPKRFDLLGLEWERPADVRIQVRARCARGKWSRWADAKPSGGHGPDGDDGRRLVTDPVWIGGADVFQIRSSLPLSGMRMHLVNATGTTTALGRARAAAERVVGSAAAASIPCRFAGQPQIIPRSAWADRGCRPRRAAGHGVVRVAFVHHTVTANAYRRRDAAAMVRGICHFHIHVQGWDDIGYNFLVDRYGQIFEGRAGGIDEPVIGAQAGGYNGSSTGIGNLGAFGVRSQSGAGFRALAQLIAWKLSLHSVPAEGRSTVEVSRQGARYSRYRAGALVSLNHIAGHRDACLTECPGGALYRQLPRLRQTVARLAPTVTVLDLHVLPVVDDTPGIPVGGRLTMGDGTPVPNAAIELQVRRKGGLRTAARAVTGIDGTFTARVVLGSAAMLRAVDRGGSGRMGVVSPAVRVAIPPRIDLAASMPATLPGTPVQLFGGVAPAKRAVSLTVASQGPDGTFTVFQTIPVPTGPDGRFSTPLVLSSPGRYRAVARTAADQVNAAGVSAPVTVLVA